jgi:two-component system response regulator AlgR
MKCLVVDDELLARQRLVRMLEDCSGWLVCGEAANGEQALQQAQARQPDVVLMDIRMPGMDGLEVARHLLQMEAVPAVVFTTAYGEHALEAFDRQAVDYLLKPIHPERLQQALDKARRLSGGQLDELADGRPGRTHLCARIRGNLELIAIEDILCLQADHKYVTVISATRQLLVEESLKSLEQEFPEHFVRVHRNALVATRAIRGLLKGADGHCRVVLEGYSERLEVSRRLLPELRQRIKSGKVDC